METNKTPFSTLSDKQPASSSAVADMETNKTPFSTLSNKPPASSSSVADVETNKAPFAPSPPVRPGRESIADQEARKVPAVPSIPTRPTHPDYRATIAQQISRKFPSVKLAAYRSPGQSRNSSSQSPQAQAQNKRLFAKARAKYAQLSPGGKFLYIVVLIAILIPSLSLLLQIINAGVVSVQAVSALSQFQAAANAIHNAPGTGADKYFNIDSLHKAQGSVDAAHSDLAALSFTLDHSPAMSMASGLLPKQISTVRALGHIAVDGSAIAQQFVAAAINAAPAVSQSAGDQNNSALAPYIPASALPALDSAFTTIKPIVDDMSVYAQELSPDSLPVSGSQRQLLASIQTIIPMFDSALAQGSDFATALGWILGVDSQRTFLVEPMDSAELRATGGFTGQFGELTLNGGHMGPLSLKNIGQYEEDHTAEGSPPIEPYYEKVIGQTAPDPYSAWWPVANFGVRDANLSFDFPTSARFIMQAYTYEFGDNLDGVIIFTPNLIQQVLQVTGPISIPQYNETITSQNLQDRLHYYQLNNAGIRKEGIVENVSDPQQARKLFTQRVTSTLLKTAEHLSITKLLPMALQMLEAMKTRDLQVYFTNPQAEALIGQLGSTASLDRSTTHDGLAIVQSNLSASKASQYVTTAIQDTVTLDAQGGATHSMQMTLDYQEKGDVYGFDTYRDYVRVYVPEDSQFISGNGFDQFDTPYCGDISSAYDLCPNDVYGDGSLVCPSGVTVGPATSYLNDPYSGEDHPLDRIGPPQNMQSDEEGRAMFGGWVVIPPNCTMKVTLSWFVPPAGNGYSLLFQPQATVAPPLNLTVVPAPGACPANTSINYSGVMDGEDTSFTLKQQGDGCSLQMSKV